MYRLTSVFLALIVSGLSYATVVTPKVTPEMPRAEGAADSEIYIKSKEPPIWVRDVDEEDMVECEHGEDE